MGGIFIEFLQRQRLKDGNLIIVAGELFFKISNFIFYICRSCC